MNIFWRIAAVFGIVIVVVSGLVPLYSATAATGGLQFETIATHPQAVAQPTATGSEIVELALDANNNLVAGYGDWTRNTGPVVINPFDIETKEFVGEKVSVPTEAISLFRNINGRLYAPWVDPRGSQDTPTSGYTVENGDGTWSNVGKVSAIHVFDITALDAAGQDLIMVGSAKHTYDDGAQGGKASAWRSTDGGQTWNVIRTEISSANINNGFERYYWTANLNGKVYMQARSVSPQPPMRVFDGTGWNNGPNELFCPESNGDRRVVNFDGKLLCAASSAGYRLFDGNSITSVKPFGALGIQRFYVEGASLYALTSNGSIYSTLDLEKWTPLAAGLSNVSSLLVYNDRMYIGSTDGRIMQSVALLSQSQPITYQPEITSISPDSIFLKEGSGEQVDIIGKDFAHGVTVTLDGKPLKALRLSSTELSMSVQKNMYSVGEKELVISNIDGSSVKSSIKFLDPGTPTIESVSFSRDATTGRVLLSASGRDFLGRVMDTPQESTVWLLGFYKRLVAFNGVPLAACATKEEAIFYKYNGIDTSTFTTDAPCYRLIRYNLKTFSPKEIYLKDTEFTVELPKNYDTQQPGRVQLLGGTHTPYRIDISGAFYF